MKESRRVKKLGLFPGFEHFYHHSYHMQGLEAEVWEHTRWFLFRDQKSSLIQREAPVLCLGWTLKSEVGFGGAEMVLSGAS